MSTKAIGIQPIQLRRSMGFNYESLRGEVTPFDQANDPPLLPFLDDDNGSVRSFSTKSTHDSFYQLSLNTAEMPAAHSNAIGTMSISLERRFISSADEGSMNAIGLFHPGWPKQLEIVKVHSSDSEASAKPAGIPQDGAKESGSAVSRTSRSEFHHQLSSFPIHGSPIQKAESTQTSLVVDCSFDANLKSIDVDKSAVQDSIESKWITFGQPFAPAALERKRSGPAELSFSSHVPVERDTVAFAKSVFVGLDDKPDIAELENRLQSLERIVMGNLRFKFQPNPESMVNGTVDHFASTGLSDQTTIQVSDSPHIIEGTETLELEKESKETASENLAVLSLKGKKLANGGIGTWRQGSKFPLRFVSKIFGKKGGGKTSRHSRAEV